MLAGFVFASQALRPVLLCSLSQALTISFRMKKPATVSSAGKSYSDNCGSVLSVCQLPERYNEHHPARCVLAVLPQLAALPIDATIHCVLD